VFFEPSQTQFDLRFRLFGIGVRITPWFWVMSAVLGWGGGPDLDRHFVAHLLIWVGCVFFSILVHELGHVVAGRLFGSEGHIVLYQMGGLAVGSSALERRWQRIAVYAAGPAAGFLLLGLVWGGVLLAGTAERGMPEMAHRAYRDLIWINLAWGLLNLLPVWPLDGGQISRDVCSGFWGDQGVRISLGLSTVVAGVLAVHCLMMEKHQPLLPFWPFLAFGGLFQGLFFALLALGSFQAYQVESQRHRRYHDDDRLPWE